MKKKTLDLEKTTWWNVDQGLALCADLENILKDCGAHVALGGSLMYRGFSLKDCDIVVYPHVQGSLKVTKIISKLGDFGFVESQSNGSFEKGPQIWIAEKDKKRVDFLFMERSEK